MFHEQAQPVKPVMSTKDSMSHDQLSFVGSYRFLFGLAFLLLIAFALLSGCEQSNNKAAVAPPAAKAAKSKRVAVLDLMDSPSTAPEEGATAETSTANAAKENGALRKATEIFGKAKKATTQKDSTATASTTETEPQETGVLQKATEIFGKAKEQSGATASDAKQWVKEKLSGAADVSSQTADDTMKWANDTFQSLKDKGLTTAKDTSEWLGQDYSNMESWEYKVITLNGTDEELTEKLNTLGKAGWDCVNAQTANDNGTRFYMKKPTFSYMRHLPFKDVIKLIPMMGGEEKK